MSTLDIFAVQPYMTLDDYASAETFYHKMDHLMRKISSRRTNSIPALAVFPEDLATFLVLADNLALIDGVSTMDEAFKRIGQALWPALLKHMVLYHTISLKRAFFLLNAAKVWRIWYTTMHTLARQYQLYIVAGSALLPDNQDGYHAASFRPLSRHIFNLSITLNPAGEVIHTTRKVNLVPTQEDTLDLTPGPLPAALSTFRIDNILCATAICYDGFRVPHTAHEPHFTALLPLLDQRNVRIIAQPSANPWWWTGSWPLNPAMTRHEQWIGEGAFSLLEQCHNIDLIVNPQLLFQALDLHFDGPSAVYGRLGGHVQILAQSSGFTPTLSSEDIVWVRWQD